MTPLIPLIPLLPLLGFAADRAVRAGFPKDIHPSPSGRSSPRGSSPWSSSSARSPTLGIAAEGVGVTLWTWIPALGFTADMGFFVDPLTACLLIVVTTIGMLVHFYSIGYMAHDPGRWRFFAYLNLFMFSMLMLVLADNFLLVFAGWELVGLCSYLLIGFWYTRRSRPTAAKKAFLVNRVGDMGFALGIMAIWTQLGTLNMQEVFAQFGRCRASGRSRSRC